MSWFSRIANVFRGGAVDRELDEERRFHLDARIDALMRNGLTREAAAEQAARQFGRPLALREASRDVKLMPWLDALVRDIRFGLRLLRKDAVVSLAAIASLALAIGACIAAFSLVDALMLRPLPVREPQRLGAWREAITPTRGAPCSPIRISSNCATRRTRASSSSP